MPRRVSCWRSDLRSKWSFPQSFARRWPRSDGASPTSTNPSVTQRRKRPLPSAFDAVELMLETAAQTLTSCRRAGTPPRRGAPPCRAGSRGVTRLVRPGPRSMRRQRVDVEPLQPHRRPTPRPARPTMRPACGGADEKNVGVADTDSGASCTSQRLSSSIHLANRGQCVSSTSWAISTVGSRVDWSRSATSGRASTYLSATASASVESSPRFARRRTNEPAIQPIAAICSTPIRPSTRRSYSSRNVNCNSDGEPGFAAASKTRSAKTPSSNATAALADGVAIASSS